MADAASVAYLRTLRAVRDRCSAVFGLALEGKTKHFALNLAKLPLVVGYVKKVMDENFPGGADTVPFHSRWRHFEAGGLDRVKGLLEGAWAGVDPLERARRMIDLAVASVLLDAGAGNSWKYVEPSTGITLSRSEGLGVASYHMFLAGAFSSNPANPHQVDAEGLRRLTSDQIRVGFQVDEAANPLVGVEGRTALLQRLGESILAAPQFFSFPAVDGFIRPGHLVDAMLAKVDASKRLSVHDLWYAVMYGFEKTWPATRTHVGATPMGDVWTYSGLPSSKVLAAYVTEPVTDPRALYPQLVPFHKLSQWMTYSLMEPLQAAGFVIEGINDMTGLPEYRNGGLLVDLGFLVPKQAEITLVPQLPESDVVVEWRALTVASLDLIAAELRKQLGVDAATFPLVKMLEGGTWKAGRVVARSLRPDGSPPIAIDSDGTVF